MKGTAMILYDAMGRPVDVNQMLRYYNQKIGPHQFAPKDPAPQPQPVQYTPLAPENEWNINLSGKSVAPETPSTTTSVSFTKITSVINISEFMNKEARLGDTLLCYNEETGELYKKYVDFLTGEMVIETAKFTKGPKAEPGITVDKLYEIVKTLSAELDEIKGAVLDVKDNS